MPHLTTGNFKGFTTPAAERSPGQQQAVAESDRLIGELQAAGPEGLLTGKKAFVFATRGGRYAGTPLDMQTAYVKQVLGFLGIGDVEFTYAEGLAA